MLNKIQPYLDLKIKVSVPIFYYTPKIQKNTNYIHDKYFPFQIIAINEI